MQHDLPLLFQSLICKGLFKVRLSIQPERKVLVDWVTDNGLSWTIEHDTFVAF